MVLLNMKENSFRRNKLFARTRPYHNTRYFLPRSWVLVNFFVFLEENCKPQRPRKLVQTLAVYLETALHVFWVSIHDTVIA